MDQNYVEVTSVETTDPSGVRGKEEGCSEYTCLPPGARRGQRGPLGPDHSHEGWARGNWNMLVPEGISTRITAARQRTEAEALWETRVEGEATTDE